MIGVTHHTAQTGIIITATLKDTGTTAYSIPGHGPLARLLNAAGNLLAQGSDTLLDGVPPIVVPPGAHVDLQAVWSSTCHLDTPATQLQFRLQGPQSGPPTSTAGGYITVSLRDIPAPGCSTQEERDPTNVGVLRIRPR